MQAQSRPRRVRQRVTEPGHEGHSLLRLGRERVRQAVQEDAELAERFAVVAHVEQRRRDAGLRPSASRSSPARTRSVATMRVVVGVDQLLPGRTRRASCSCTRAGSASCRRRRALEIGRPVAAHLMHHETMPRCGAVPGQPGDALVEADQERFVEALAAVAEAWPRRRPAGRRSTRSAHARRPPCSRPGCRSRARPGRRPAARRAGFPARPCASRTPALTSAENMHGTESRVSVPHERTSWKLNTSRVRSSGLVSRG